MDIADAATANDAQDGQPRFLGVWNHVNWQEDMNYNAWSVLLPDMTSWVIHGFRFLHRNNWNHKALMASGRLDITRRYAVKLSKRIKKVKSVWSSIWLALYICKRQAVDDFCNFANQHLFIELSWERVKPPLPIYSKTSKVESELHKFLLSTWLPAQTLKSLHSAHCSPQPERQPLCAKTCIYWNLYKRFSNYLHTIASSVLTLIQLKL